MIRSKIFPLLVISYISCFANSFGSPYPVELFVNRRAAVMNTLQSGIAVLFAQAEQYPGTKFRQDNDFYYLTGIEEKNAILVMFPENKTTSLFLERQTEREAMIEGKNLLHSIDDAKTKTGITHIYPISYFDEMMARLSGKTSRIIHMRLSPGDTQDSDRGETGIFTARRKRNRYNSWHSPDMFRVMEMKNSFPEYEFIDISGILKTMREIKSPEEIHWFRKNSELTARAHIAAMKATHPGVFEYQIEAEALNVIKQGGAENVSYPPIVGSGPNSCVWHYSKNNRKTETGDLIVMDFGADLHYTCTDCTRTWPVSGKFTEEQSKYYQIVLDVQKESIKLYKPGVTAEDIKKRVAELMKEKGIDTEGVEGGIHHFVGLSTHDGYLGDRPLKAGMILVFEPGIHFPEKNMGIQIEDTILITETGCEVLTDLAPREIKEIESLISRK